MLWDFGRKKRVWIIGASSGIGAGLVQLLAEKGAKLIIPARSEAKLHELEKKPGNRGNPSSPSRCGTTFHPFCQNARRIADFQWLGLRLFECRSVSQRLGVRKQT
ncbi:SDR family NAD(P)-dependent oxidoreductase [Algoriphagus boritolerans]|uniref:SDR family NAD(P)-dependent oxidoreductase n=1 Tax=Algoriphagus boritolerans TaxID=308111 RepID=UPI003A101562